MELLIFRHSEYLHLYNCSPQIYQKMYQFYLNGDDLIPSFYFESFTIIFFGLIAYLLYIPCLLIIYKYINTQCVYIILFYIGLTDLLNICVCGFLTAWLSLQRASFCIYPNLIYFSGMIGVFLWIGETTADLILAFNRCLFAISPFLARLFFGKKRTYIWLLFSSLYAFYCLCFTPPLIFSPKYFAWFGSPYVGFSNSLKEEEYNMSLLDTQNYIVAITSPLTYFIFSVVFFLKNKALKVGNNTSLSKPEKLTFLQVFIISFLNTSVAESIPQWIYSTAEIGWLVIHGSPPLIYLTLNKTIRQDFKYYFYKIINKLKNLIKKQNLNNNNNLIHPAQTNNYIGHD
ncbi:hypothetical protein Mgra_00003742 [Meloidogyne graminicola]|uniref:Serpentine receptor class gamma n=1 Tax=Meloidogyne graminicola TaxID=189291 RepID=A0A8S9ZU44_9BILA|nr:hypothetical protein Mgra_00003742 [Meloidogyne graminicola]